MQVKIKNFTINSVGINEFSNLISIKIISNNLNANNFCGNIGISIEILNTPVKFMPVNNIYLLDFQF